MKKNQVNTNRTPIYNSIKKKKIFRNKTIKEAKEL